MAGRTGPATFRLWVAEIRSHLAVIRASSRQIPGELARIGRELAVEVREQGPWRIVLLATGLLVLGYGIQRAYWTMTRGWRKQVLAMPLETVQQRLSVVGFRLGYNLLWLLSFALGSLGALLLFQWPPLLKTILSAVFIIIVVALLWGVLARFLLSPHNRRLRVFPIDDAAARHWTRWSAVLLSWFFGGWITLQVLRDLDVDQPVRAPIAYAWACCFSRWRWSRSGGGPRFASVRSSAGTGPGTSRSPCPCCLPHCGCFGCSAP